MRGKIIIISIIFFGFLFSLNFVSAVWTENLNDELIAYYDFDESNGTTVIDNEVDDTKNGTLIGGSDQNWVTGILGNAYNINITSGAGFNMSYPVNSTNGTFNFWIASHVDAGAFGKDEPSVVNGDWIFWHPSNKFGFRIDDAGVRKDLVPDVDIQNNVFTMVTLTWNSSGAFKMYINSTKQSNELTGIIERPDTENGCWGLGVSIGSACSIGASINATMDEFGYWNIELNQSQVTQLYNNGTGITFLPPPH